MQIAAESEELDWDLCQLLNPRLARLKDRVKSLDKRPRQQNAFDLFLKLHFQAVGCGQLLWESKSFETPRPYVRVPKGVNPHLLRYPKLIFLRSDQQISSQGLLGVNQRFQCNCHAQIPGRTDMGAKKAAALDHCYWRGTRF